MIIVGIPIVIHILFRIYPTGRWQFFAAEWSAGELLQYYGSVLTFCGTLILGALSFYQNETIRQEANIRRDVNGKLFSIYGK